MENLEIKVSNNSEKKILKFRKALKSPRFLAWFVAWNIVYYTAKCSLIYYGCKVGYNKIHESSSANLITNNYQNSP